MRRQPRQRRERKQRKPSRAEAVALIAAALASGATAQAIADKLQPRLGIPMKVLLPLIVVALSRPLTYGLTIGPRSTAVSRTQEQEAARRAAYVWAASGRVLAASDQAAALAAEKRYFDQHVHAMRKRRDASIGVDRAAAKYGPELGWYSKMDSRTTGECREANGKNFDATKMPAIGWPGMVHPHCRCRAGKPHANAGSVYNVKADAA